MVKDILDKKKNGVMFSYEDIRSIVDGYVTGEVSDADMREFVMYVYENELSFSEINYLTDVMIKSGEVIDLSAISKVCVDKHSSGGIGDKITLIVSPIVASLGVCVPKMSGRGLGITGGTADKLESIPGFKINMSKKSFMKALDEAGVCVISQSEKIAVADKKIYALRNEIGAVDSTALIASSIMSKKIASGADKIVIDLKVGNGAFMKDLKSASKLAKTMIEIGKYYDRKVVCVLSDMNVPLGYNIGNALEVKEAIDFFDGMYEKRLYFLVVYLSSIMVSLGKGICFRSAKKLVVDAIDSGLARHKFYEWIKYQGGKISKFKVDADSVKVLSDVSGYINSIDAQGIGKLVFDLGGGRVKKEDSIDYGVGVSLKKTVGEKVVKGEVLCEIFYNKKVRGMEKRALDAFVIGKRKRKEKSVVIKTIK